MFLSKNILTQRASSLISCFPPSYRGCTSVLLVLLEINGFFQQCATQQGCLDTHHSPLLFMERSLPASSAPCCVTLGGQVTKFWQNSSRFLKCIQIYNFSNSMLESSPCEGWNSTKSLVWECQPVSTLQIFPERTWGQFLQLLLAPQTIWACRFHSLYKISCLPITRCNEISPKSFCIWYWVPQLESGTFVHGWMPN